MEGYRYHDMVEQYAKRFPALDADMIYKTISFDSITAWLVKWKEDREYADRYMENERMLNAIQPPSQ